MWYADWTPRVEDPQWQTYLSTLAAAADVRRAELGDDVAAEAPQWADLSVIAEHVADVR